MKKNKNSKIEFGFFLSDASFNHLSKTSVGIIINLETGKKREYYFENVKNSLDAEKKTMYKAIQFAATEKYQSPVFVCDNKFAVQQVKKEFFQSELLRGKFVYAQFLWLPREFMHVVDFFTKNLNLALLEKEEEAFKEAIDAKTKELANSYGICFDFLKKKELKKVKENTLSEKENNLLKLIKEFIYNSSYDIKTIEELEKWNEKNIEEKVFLLEKISKKFPRLEILIQDLLALITV